MFLWGPLLARQSRKQAEKDLQPISISRELGLPRSTLAQAAGNIIGKAREVGFIVERRGERTTADVLAEEFTELHPEATLRSSTLEGLYDGVHGLSPGRAALCISGSGLRATFLTIGLIEGLARHRLLSNFHFLSMSSAAGYVGGWLSALRYFCKNDADAFSTLIYPPGLLDPSGQRRLPFDLISTFHTSQRGVLSGDVWTNSAIYLRNVFLTLLVFGSLFMTCLMVPKLYLEVLKLASIVSHDIWIDALGGAVILMLLAAVTADIYKLRGLRIHVHKMLFYWMFLLPVLGVTLCLSIATFEMMNYSSMAIWGWAVGIGASIYALGRALVLVGSARRGGQALYGFLSCLTSGGVVASVAVIGLVWLPDPESAQAVEGLRNVSAMATVLTLGGTFGMGFAYFLGVAIYAALVSHGPGALAARAWQATASGRLLRVSSFWGILSGIDLIGVNAASQLLSPFIVGGIGAVGGISGLLALVLSFGSFSQTGWRAAIAKVSVHTAELAAIILLFVLGIGLSFSIDFVVEKIANYFDTSRWFATVIVMITFVNFTFFIGYFVDLTSFSHHEAQRQQFAGTFIEDARRSAGLGASPSSIGDDDPAVAELWRQGKSRQLPCLLPVINMALDLFADERHRKSESFTVTPFACGSPYSGYRFSTEYASPGGLKLSTAMAISNANKVSNWPKSLTPLTELLFALLGIREGRWLGQPCSDSASARGRPRVAFLPTISELCGRASAEYIHTSSANRFEALGLYEMIRRRCRYIVVSDAACDLNYTMDDLRNALHKIKVDFRVDITFERIEMRARTSVPNTSLYCAIGQIRYPEAPELIGTMIYIKPGVDGSEPPLVRSYAAARSSFPHEVISDRNFLEQDRDIYRRLGHHMVEQLCKYMKSEMKNAVEPSLKLFVESAKSYLNERLRTG
jgi:hypothetical protein